MIDVRKRIGIIKQVALLFLIGIITTGVITYFVQHHYTNINVKKQMETIAENVASEVTLAVKEYPSWQWLLRYWYTHGDELDIEYDVDYGESTATEEKCALFMSRHPEIQMRYATEDELKALPEEDRKLYAEITYSWLITHINQIKRAYDVDYLFGVVTDATYQTQEFLFSAADEGSVRGTQYLEVYPLGTKVSVAENEGQQNAMRYARRYTSHLVDAGDYVDYYAYLTDISNKTVLIGLTYDLSGLKTAIYAQAKSQTVLTIIHQLILSLICLGLIFLFILRPLKKVQQSIRLYTQTKDSETVIKELSKMRFSNEIGDLADDVGTLATEIDAYLNRIARITSEKERIEAELSLASRIQESMLPNEFPAFPGRKDFEIFASMMPAREVGGDFYDYFLVDDDHLALVMADVSGKGIPAALFMMVSMIMIHTQALNKRSPADVLQTVNYEICAHNHEEMFVSVWLGILELSTGKLTAANAGHEYPILKNGDGHFEVIRRPHDFVIGGLGDIRYKEYELMLQPGAKLFLYTDGVPEATSAGKELFGMDRTVEALRDAEGKAPEDILNTVDKHVNVFVGEAEQFDDLTMLCLHYKGKS